MIPLTVAEIASVVGGRLHDVSDPAATVDAPPASDSREVAPGGLFAAIRGDRTDGHDHAAQAVDRGAVVVLASRPVGYPAIVVSDVLQALGALAHFVFSKLNPVTIGITGSVGKTTTKDLLGAILESDATTVATARSYNNELGLPLTVLRAGPHTRYLVLEMGAGNKGDITYLTGIAQPQVGVVLTVGHAHVRTLGSLDDIAAAKAELAEALPAAACGGTAVLNADDPRVAAMAQRTQAHVTWFGRSGPATVRAEGVCLDRAGRPRFLLRTPTGTAPVQLQVLGEHQVNNALAAAAAAWSLGIATGQIAQVLTETQRRAPGRMEVLDAPGGVTVVNDAYNANPESMQAGLRALTAMAAGRRTVAVLGEMTGQAQASRKRHEEIGRLAAELGVNVLIAVGGDDPASMAEAAGAAGGPGIVVGKASDRSAALRLVRGLLRTGDVVLVKASSEAGFTQLATDLSRPEQ
ncbi:MAG TPA: UDP-N-acetylmuramoyl-tripeptide--D-alanyl-D-alanine ligase [Streptosporangiaceae bacterium]|nr:UDP-N-acetylmuramoyl-tripeptide--D-alanyl-D-alanine ligase [Streptosporangiaceae bacterium]